MNVREITKNIFHLKFSTQSELASTFLRFQEYYESPKFKGGVFTLEEYKKWYIANSTQGKKTGKFTYYQDWTGFNIPSKVLKPFYQGQFDPLSDKEKGLLELFKDKKDEKFYIIGTFGKSSALKHEIAHGLFYTNESYKNEVLKILEEISKKTKEKINNMLRDTGGYHQSVLTDELHAFVLCKNKKLKEKKIYTKALDDVSERLNKIFKKYG